MWVTRYLTCKDFLVSYSHRILLRSYVAAVMMKTLSSVSQAALPATFTDLRQASMPREKF